MFKINTEKVGVTVALTALTDIFGLFALPMLLMVVCNIIDYMTGLFASKYRNERIDSYKSIHGIIKKVCMWLLVVVGAVVDGLIVYAANTVGMDVSTHFVVATLVAVWIVVSEVISILENLADIGVDLPPFLMPIVQRIKKEVESAGESKTGRKSGGGE